MKKFISMIILSVMVGMFTGCASDTVVSINSDVQQKQQTEQVMQEINRQVGMPNITNFYEKKMAKKIFELRDDSKLITHAYMTNLNGKFIYIGKCMGYGLPYSVQYTNPEKMGVVEGGKYNAVNPYTIPQADPNGLFMPEGLSATWLMLLDEETGKQEIMYVEQEIVVTQSKLPKRLCEGWSLPNDY